MAFDIFVYCELASTIVLLSLFILSFNLLIIVIKSKVKDFNILFLQNVNKIKVHGEESTLTYSTRVRR